MPLGVPLHGRVRHALDNPFTRNFDPTLVLDLPFSEGVGNTAYDRSLYGNHGAIYGASWVDGQIGKALSFDGVNDYVEITHSASINLINAFTIMAWTRFKTQSAGYKHVIFKNEAYGLTVIPDGVDGYIYLFGEANSIYSRAVVTINPNIFYHIAVTSADGLVENAKYYLNGAQVTTTPIVNGAIAVNTSNLILAALRPDFGWADIFCDEVRIYNRALSVAEILNLYNEGE